MKLLDVKILTGTDDNADLSYLGEFTDSPTEQYTGEDGLLHWRDNIEREVNYSYKPVFKYFCPTDREHGEEALKRAEAYGLEWNMMFIVASAEVEIRGASQTFLSPGLYGIESDIGKDYIREVIDEEVESLLDILETTGVITTEADQHKFWELAEKAKAETEY